MIGLWIIHIKPVLVLVIVKLKSQTLDYDYWFNRIYYRNCEMINQSDFILFYAQNQQNSGAYKAFKYAKKDKKDFMNIADLTNVKK